MSDVRIINGGLEDDDLVKGQIVLRGVIDQATLKYIKIDWYQREQGFSPTHINKIVSALFLGSSLADITLGMRGQHFDSRGGVYSLHDKCYCIDGGQRLYGAAMALKERPDLRVRIGAKTYFDTTEEFENDLFCTLGSTQIRISPSVLMRNRKKKSPAADLLIEITKSPVFALKDRIAWGQIKTRHELMAAFTFARIVGALHAHKSGGLRSAQVYDLLNALDRLVDKVGEETVHGNTVRFFDLVDKCWAIRQLTGGRDPRPQLKPVFLMTIGRLISRYPIFWDGNDLYIQDKHVKKLRGFKLAHYVQPANPVPTEALYELLRKQLGLDPILEEREAAE